MDAWAMGGGWEDGWVGGWMDEGHEGHEGH